MGGTAPGDGAADGLWRATEAASCLSFSIICAASWRKRSRNNSRNRPVLDNLADRQSALLLENTAARFRQLFGISVDRTGIDADSEQHELYLAHKRGGRGSSFVLIFRGPSSGWQ